MVQLQAGSHDLYRLFNRIEIELDRTSILTLDEIESKSLLLLTAPTPALILTFTAT